MGFSETWPFSAWPFLERLVFFVEEDSDDDEVDPFFLPRRVGCFDSMAPFVSPLMEALGGLS